MKEEKSVSVLQWRNRVSSPINETTMSLSETTPFSLSYLMNILLLLLVT